MGSILSRGMWSLHKTRGGSVRGEQLVPRASFFQLNEVRRARQHGVPLRVIAHEDVLVFGRPS
jgi:hypothetical protein